MIVITEITMASSYLFFGVSPRYLFVPYALFLGGNIFIDNKDKYKLPKWNTILFGTVFLYYVWVLIVQLGVHRYSIFGYRFHRFMGRSFMYVATGFLIQFFIDSKSELMRFIRVVIISCGISALVGIGQVIFGGVFLSIRELLQKSPQTVGVSPTDRAFGLQLFHIPFSYDMLMGSFLAIPLWGELKNKKEKLKSVGFFILIVTGLIFSMTRSAIGGLILGLVLVAASYKKMIRFKKLLLRSGWQIILLAVLLFVGLEHISDAGRFDRITSTTDGSFRVRRTLFTAGFRIIRDNPLGIGNGRYEEYVENNSERFRDIKNWRKATDYGVHNHFLLNTIYFGWPAGILSLIFMVQLFFIAKKVFKEGNSKFLKNMSIVITGFLVAYIVNISFHNAGFFKGEATIWIVTGILLSLNRIAKRENESGS